MLPPACGIGWCLWRRHRLGLSALAFAFLAVGALYRALPAGEARNWAPLTTLLLFGFLYLAAIFASPEADLAGRPTAYPSGMLTLPVPTRDLVLWPMLFGAIALAGAWVVFAGLILAPLGAGLPLWWPAAML